MTQSHPVIRLLAGRHRRVRDGSPWVYSNEIEMNLAAKALAPGSLVRLETHGGEPLGAAMFNPRTLIAARLLSRDPGVEINADFFSVRLAQALALREFLYPGGCYRLVHAEADGLPGLIIDRFGEALVVQANTAGMDRLWPELAAALDDLIAPRVVVRRDDSSARTLEGLPSAVEVAKGQLDQPIELAENGARFLADLTGGQKTGWFYDQRENRAIVAALCAEAHVLDVYAYGGGFAIMAARGGAASVVAIDRSPGALELAERSAELNGVEKRCRFVRANAFDEMARMGTTAERFGVVVADPPAFVKSKKDLAPGLRGYRKMTRLAATLCASGGFLFVASCSHNVTPDMFAEEVWRGVREAGRSARVLRALGASPDHPVHPALPETAYLKASLLQVE
jgi:23S rRNA (cytosine1962-C5)-methyltransferase